MSEGSAYRFQLFQPSSRRTSWKANQTGFLATEKDKNPTKANTV